MALFLDSLSQKVLKQGTAHPQRLCKSLGQWFLTDSHGVLPTLGRVVGSRTVTRQGAEIERYMDVLAARPGSNYPPQRPHHPSK